VDIENIWPISLHVDNSLQKTTSFADVYDIATDIPYYSTTFSI
jgi:hypothetical protein